MNQATINDVVDRDMKEQDEGLYQGICLKVRLFVMI